LPRSQLGRNEGRDSRRALRRLIGRKHGLPMGLSYSFDMLLPIIELRDAHYAIDLKGWPRYYFYAHKIAGFVLASFLMAGISGLTK